MQDPTSGGTALSLGLTSVRVTSMRWEARDILSIELRRDDGAPLAAAAPGAHVDLHFPSAMVRPYSLIQAEGPEYIVAIKREAESRGASAYAHERLRVGDVIEVSAPRNHFALAGGVAASVLVAGGIGITPLLSMAQALEREKRDWRLYYSLRDAASPPFGRWIRRWHGRVRLHGSAVDGRMNLGEIVATSPAGAHFYCCGPASMLESFAEATRHVDPARLHLERFGPATPARDSQGLDLVLARSGRVLRVEPHSSVLDALLDAGVTVAHSCRQGICGSCEVPVLEGVPEHRDEVLTEMERARNDRMMVCCSRALGGRLVLDL